MIIWFVEVYKSWLRLNITSTKWWVNCVSGAKILGRDNVFIENVLNDCGGKIFFKDYLIEYFGDVKLTILIYGNYFEFGKI